MGLFIFPGQGMQPQDGQVAQGDTGNDHDSFKDKGCQEYERIIRRQRHHMDDEDPDSRIEEPIMDEQPHHYQDQDPCQPPRMPV